MRSVCSEQTATNPKTEVPMKSIVAAVLIVGQVGLKKPKLSVLVLTVCRILWTKQMLWVQRSLLEPARL